MVNSTADRMKLTVQLIEIAEKVTKVLANYSIFVCRSDTRFCGYILT